MGVSDYPILPNLSGIPVSLRSPSMSLMGWPIEKPATQCWECATPLRLGLFGPYQYCDGCVAAMRREAREDARREIEDDSD